MMLGKYLRLLVLAACAFVVGTEFGTPQVQAAPGGGGKGGGAKGGGRGLGSGYSCGLGGFKGSGKGGSGGYRGNFFGSSATSYRHHNLFGGPKGSSQHAFSASGGSKSHGPAHAAHVSTARANPKATIPGARAASYGGGGTKSSGVHKSNPTVAMVHSGTILKPISECSAPKPGTRQTGINRAWKQEVELIQKTGKGTAPWTKHEIDRIKGGASYKDLGFTGHHINLVRDKPAWAGDPRNIAFLKQGKNESHMTLGHKGGTNKTQPEGALIDREAMLRAHSKR